MIRTAAMTRDKNRTPMQWSNLPNAGFSPIDVSTWLPVNPNYKEGINVKEQERSPYSLLNYYKHLLQVRKNMWALLQGDFTPSKPPPKTILHSFAPSKSKKFW